MDTSRIYESHPLSKASILARLARQSADTQDLREWDLAIDPESDITDQNHAGGVQAVLELASAAGVTRASRVVDIGAGLGGSARVLAAAIGCQVVAVEQDRRRHDDSTSLTKMVRLEDRVSALCIDATTATADGECDVLWGQSAWVHFSSPERFLDLWLPRLKRNGRVAMSDSHLARAPRTESERTLLEELELHWGSHLTPVDRWIGHLESAGFRVVHSLDRSDDSLLHFKKLQMVSTRWPPGMLTEFEATGWRRAIAALQAGLIKSARIVASR